MGKPPNAPRQPRPPWRFRPRSTAQTQHNKAPTRSPIPVLPQLRPILQPLPDLALEAALGRVVELPAPHGLWEVVLAGKRFGGVVIVVVARAVAFRFHQFGRRVEDVLGRQQRAAL